ncbi:FtsW/RodA/SpoVE family cell cycle protein [Actinobacteria bacterium YIM 96077]|uniref:FtsW/RodA/SpoVE family cell cycle protein n=1 Tax=Phytoactinopolyspora halophila TaxID=1981511 RepID=A0A329QSM2_9ACTN|nr:FtsW/RodA/SpoVE family cell cycle protein [Phytoactinopolyspora halophila]AYY11381.1 FtsW/RodA/SpoVE family cell cycle protein [Actinobacteria bacterium YIM 96077]RAW14669.1 FtsW/RodA/SpoVE family cell cycle protein [Phytoactinopolyspora halophila]
MSFDQHRAPTAPADESVVPRRGRGTELILLIFAAGISTFAYVNVDLGVRGDVPPNALAYLSGFFLVAGIAHVVIRMRAPYADPTILPIVVTLCGLGLAMIHRLDLTDDTTLAATQLTWMLVGVALFIGVLIAISDHRVLARYPYLAGLSGLVLLILPLLPFIGHDIRGAQIWIQIAGMSFQPNEAAKIVLIIAFAAYLVKTRDALALAGRRFLGVDLPRARDLGPILLVWLGGLGILTLQNDLGPSILLFGIFVLLIYIATERISWVILGLLLIGVGAFTAYHVVAHVQNRFDLWLNPLDDPSNQIAQSLFGLAHGGAVGTGLGQGYPDMIPIAESDFIGAALGEELGLAGLTAIILLYALLVSRGLKAALVIREPFGKLLAAGLASGLMLQVFIVLGGVTRLIPMSGMTTPFLALGGSSLVMNWALVALLIRLSDAARRPAPTATPSFSDDAVTQVVRVR